MIDPNEIDEALKEYSAGTKTFDETADFLKNYDWPNVPETADNYTSHLPDFKPSIDDIYGACLDKIITYGDYVKFNQIARKAMQAAGKEV